MKVQMKKYGYIGLLCLLPLFIQWMLSFVNGGSILEIIPNWSDEEGYYQLMASALEYGQPLGFTGYNNSHAVVGHWGFHGFFILLPYILFCRIFGLHYYSIALCNILMLCLALLIFYIMVKPSMQKMLLISVICSCSPFTLFFLNTTMVEGIHYFFSIVFAGVFICLLKEKRKNILILAWILAIAASLVKVTWVCVIFPLALVTFERISFRFRLALSVLTTGGMSMLLYGLFSLSSSPYFTSQISTFIGALQADVLSGMLYIIRMFIYNLYGPLQAAITTKSPLYITVAMLMYVTIILSIINVIVSYKKKEKEESKRNSLFAMYMILAYYFGVAMLYDGSLVPLRTCYPAVLLALIIIAYQKENQSNVLCGAILCYAVIHIFCVHEHERKYNNADYTEYISTISDFMKKNIEIDREGDAWRNTIAIDAGTASGYIMEVPAGMAYNLYRLDLEMQEGFPQYILYSNELGDAYEIYCSEYGYYKKDSNGIVTLLEHQTE